MQGTKCHKAELLQRLYLIEVGLQVWAGTSLLESNSALLKLANSYLL